MKNKLLATAVALGVLGALVAIPASAVAKTKCLGGPYTDGGYNDGVCQSVSVKPKLENTSIGGWQTDKLVISFKLTDKARGAYFIKSFTLDLPSGVTLNRAGDINVGVKFKTTTSAKGNVVTVTLDGPVNVLTVDAKAGAFSETKNAKKAKKVKLGLAVKSDAGDSFAYSISS